MRFTSQNIIIIEVGTKKEMRNAQKGTNKNLTENAMRKIDSWLISLKR